MTINIPNQITLARLGLSGVFFALLVQVSFDRTRPSTLLLAACFWLFLVASLSDVLDGLLARMWRQVTTFGRVLDPVVDKVLVCGAYVFFASQHFYDPSQRVNVTGVEPWMAVLILLRELLVSAIRAQRESTGHDFSANWVGKVKMFVQSATACVILGHLAWFPAMSGLARACVWLTVIVTAASTIAYLRRAAAFLNPGCDESSVRDAATAAAAPRSVAQERLRPMPPGGSMPRAAERAAV